MQLARSAKVAFSLGVINTATRSVARSALLKEASFTIDLNQQWGVWLIVASLAVVVVVAEGFCVAIAQLASRSRLRQLNARGRELLSSELGLIGSAGAGVMGPRAIQPHRLNDSS